MINTLTSFFRIIIFLSKGNNIHTDPFKVQCAVSRKFSLNRKKFKNYVQINSELSDCSNIG